MSLLTRFARSLPLLSLLCALTILPAATVQWSAWSGGDDGARQAWTARRCVIGAVCGRRSTDLRELFRASERWRASFLSLVGQSSRLNLTLRAATSLRARANQQGIAARRSLLRYASGRADDDPPA